MLVDLRASPGICVYVAAVGTRRGPQPDRVGTHVRRLDKCAYVSTHMVGVASRRQASIMVVSVGLGSRQL